MSHYRIERLIGVGGLGMVYEARWLLPCDESMPVACKVMRDDLHDTPHYRDFMRQEAAIGMRLGHNHPNLVTVFDFFEDDRNRPCMAMELVHGGSVADLLDAYHRLPATVVRRIAIKVLSALACLHGAQVLHRDLSPCNVLVSTTGAVKLSDLNLVKRMDHGQAHTHTFRGKPAYASPEARENGPLDARSDLYSFGVILYQMLAGKPPWGDERDPDRILACSKGETFAPLPAGTPPDLATLAMGLLRSQPEARKPQRAHEALALLRRSGKPTACGADLGGLVTAAMQRRTSERRAGDMAQQELLVILAPGDMLVARAIDVTEPTARAVPDARPESVSSSATTEDYSYSVTVAPPPPGTSRMAGRRSFADSRPKGRGRQAARLVALLVVVMAAGAALGVLLYQRLATRGQLASTHPGLITREPPAPAQPAEPAPAPAPTLARDAMQRERPTQDHRRKVRRAVDPQDHIAPRALSPIPRMRETRR